MEYLSSARQVGQRGRMPRRHDPELIRAIGARLADLRRGRALTQEQLAEAAGLEPLTISRAEVGARALSLANLAGVANVLGVKLGDIVDVDRPAPAAERGLDEQEWINLWRQLEPARRDLALRIVREFVRG